MITQILNLGLFFASWSFGKQHCISNFASIATSFRNKITLRLRALVGLLSHFATRRNRKMTLLVATTGDTGPAAVKAVSDIDNPLLTILVHYPQGQISDFQRKQLTTIQSPCVKVVAFEGGGDDMDRPIKNLQAHRQQNGKPEDGVLTGVNSYNIARPLMQMVHYVSAKYPPTIYHAKKNII